MSLFLKFRLYMIFFHAMIFYFLITHSPLFETPSSEWISLDTLVFSTNKADRNDIAEILLKVTLNTINTNPHPTKVLIYQCQSAKIWVENIMDLVYNTVRVTHIYKHGVSNTMTANRHSPLNSKSSYWRLHFAVIFLIYLIIVPKSDFGLKLSLWIVTWCA